MMINKVNDNDKIKLVRGQTDLNKINISLERNTNFLIVSTFLVFDSSQRFIERAECQD